MGADNQQERLLSADYVVGFVDGEGCFSVTVHPHPTSRFKWVIDPAFAVYQHQNDRAILERIQAFFRCGRIIPKGPRSGVLMYVVDSRRTIAERIIPFFDRHTLCTSKQSDYLKFREIVLRMENKEHWTVEGFLALVEIAFSMNAAGKQRNYRKEDIIRSILRDHTPDTSSEEMVRTA